MCENEKKSIECLKFQNKSEHQLNISDSKPKITKGIPLEQVKINKKIKIKKN